MLVFSLVAAGLAAVLHVLIFRMESLTWTQPSTWKRFGLASQEAAETTRPLAFNQGFYNLFLAIGTGVGVAAIVMGERAVGLALLYFGCGSMLAASLVLLSTGKKYARAAFTQGLLPFVAIVGGVFSG